MEPSQKVFRMKIWEGIFKPTRHFSTLSDSEKIKGLPLRVIFLCISMGIISGLLDYFIFSLFFKLFEGGPLASLYVLVGMIVIIATVFFEIINTVFKMFIMSLLLLIFFRSIPFIKLFAMQVYTFVITAIGYTLLFPITFYSKGLHLTFLFDGIKQMGHIGPTFFVYFGFLLLFLVWQVYVLIVGLNQLSTKSKEYVAWVVILIYFVFIGGKLALFSLFLFS